MQVLKSCKVVFNNIAHIFSAKKQNITVKKVTPLFINAKK